MWQNIPFGDDEDSSSIDTLRSDIARTIDEEPAICSLIPDRPWRLVPYGHPAPFGPQMSDFAYPATDFLFGSCCRSSGDTEPALVAPGSLEPASRPSPMPCSERTHGADIERGVVSQLERDLRSGCGAWPLRHGCAGAVCPRLAPASAGWGVTRRG